MEKPLYTLVSIQLLLRYALNYGMDTNDFSINCRAGEGFTVTILNENKDFFQVINTVEKVLIYTQPNVECKKEYHFNLVNNNIYSLKHCFDQWIRAVYLMQRVVR
jgi:hypothetical protein